MIARELDDDEAARERQLIEELLRAVEEMDNAEIEIAAHSLYVLHTGYEVDTD